MFLSGTWHPSEERKRSQRIEIRPIQSVSWRWIHSSWGRLQSADLSKTYAIHSYLTVNITLCTCWFDKRTYASITWEFESFYPNAEELWNLRSRLAIKKVMQKCLSCKMAKKPRCQQIKSPLPAFPIKAQKNFRSQESTSHCLCLSWSGFTAERFILLVLHALPYGPSTWHYAPIWPPTCSCVPCSDSWKDEDCHTKYMDNAQTFHKQHLAQLWNSVCGQNSQISRSTQHYRSSSLRGRLGVDDDGRDCSRPRNLTYVRYYVDYRSLKGRNTTHEVIDAAIHSRPIE